MGLATIDPHSQNMQTKLYKIPKFGVNRYSRLKMSKFTKKCIAIPTQSPDAIHFFVNFEFFKSLYLSQN